MDPDITTADTDYSDESSEELARQFLILTGVTTTIALLTVKEIKYLRSRAGIKERLGKQYLTAVQNELRIANPKDLSKEELAKQQNINTRIEQRTAAMVNRLIGDIGLDQWLKNPVSIQIIQRISESSALTKDLELSAEEKTAISQKVGNALYRTQNFLIHPEELQNTLEAEKNKPEAEKDNKKIQELNAAKRENQSLLKDYQNNLHSLDEKGYAKITALEDATHYADIFFPQLIAKNTNTETGKTTTPVLKREALVALLRNRLIAAHLVNPEEINKQQLLQQVITDLRKVYKLDTPEIPKDPNLELSPKTGKTSKLPKDLKVPKKLSEEERQQLEQELAFLNEYHQQELEKQDFFTNRLTERMNFEETIANSQNEQLPTNSEPPAISQGFSDSSNNLFGQIGNSFLKRAFGGARALGGATGATGTAATGAGATVVATGAGVTTAGAAAGAAATGAGATAAAASAPAWLPVVIIVGVIVGILFLAIFISTSANNNAVTKPYKLMIQETPIPTTNGTATNSSSLSQDSETNTVDAESKAEILKLLPSTLPTIGTGAQNTATINVIKGCLKNKSVYQEAADKTGINWLILAGIHYAEASCNSEKSPLSGDKKISSSTTLLSETILAGEALKTKNGGSIPNSYQELVQAVALYNGPGNTQCDHLSEFVPYPKKYCPAKFKYADHLYALNFFNNEEYGQMYVVYCGNSKKCTKITPYQKPGVLTAIRILIGE